MSALSQFSEPPACGQVFQSADPLSTWSSQSKGWLAAKNGRPKGLNMAYSRSTSHGRYPCSRITRYVASSASGST